MTYNNGVNYGVGPAASTQAGNCPQIQNGREVKDRDAARKIQQAQQNQYLPQFAPQPHGNTYVAQVVIHQHMVHQYPTGGVSQRVNTAGRGAMPQHQQQMPAIYSKPYSQTNPNPNQMYY